MPPALPTTHLLREERASCFCREKAPATCGRIRAAGVLALEGGRVLGPFLFSADNQFFKRPEFFDLGWFVFWFFDFFGRIFRGFLRRRWFLLGRFIGFGH